MRRWTLYPFVLMAVLVMAAAITFLAKQQPIPTMVFAGAEPLIVRIYGVLRVAEPVIFGVFALLLIPVVIGRLQRSATTLDPAPERRHVWMASVWYFALVVVGGVLAIVFIHPFGVGESAFQAPGLTSFYDTLVRAVRGLNDDVWLFTSGLFLVLTLLFLPWRHPDALHQWGNEILIPTLFLINTIALLVLNHFYAASWLWVGLASLLFPTTILWLLLWSRVLRKPDSGTQLFSFVLLLILMVPVVFFTGILLSLWMGPLPGSPIELETAEVRALLHRLPPLKTVLPWLATIGAALVLIFIGIICRRTTDLLEVLDRVTLPRRKIRLPRWKPRRMKIIPLQTGFSLIDLPLAVIFGLVERLGNAAISILSLMIRVITTMAEWIMRTIYFVVVTLLNLFILLVVHLAFTLINLPKLLLKAWRYVLETWDDMARSLLLPLLGCLMVALGLMLVINNAVSYFLIGEAALLLWGMLGFVMLLSGIIIGLSAVSGHGPGETAYWYLDGFVSIIPYPMIVLCMALWALIFIAPRFGIHHFQAGLVTWSLTILIGGVMIGGLLLGKRELQYEA